MENAIEQTFIPATKKRIEFNEDWVVVFLGFSIILLALIVMMPLTPAYNWSNGADLLNKIFTPANLTSIAIQLLFVLLVALAGALLTGKPFSGFIVVFTVVYFITILAII